MNGFGVFVQYRRIRGDLHGSSVDGDCISYLQAAEQSALLLAVAELMLCITQCVSATLAHKVLKAELIILDNRIRDRQTMVAALPV